MKQEFEDTYNLIKEFCAFNHFDIEKTYQNY